MVLGKTVSGNTGTPAPPNGEDAISSGYATARLGDTELSRAVAARHDLPRLRLRGDKIDGRRLPLN
jgi:hypothetical protein